MVNGHYRTDTKKVASIRLRRCRDSDSTWLDVLGQAMTGRVPRRGRTAGKLVAFQLHSAVTGPVHPPPAEGEPIQRLLDLSWRQSCRDQRHRRPGPMGNAEALVGTPS
jgi:hypothetical protein